MRKDALFWSNVCNASRHTILDAPHYLRKQRQEDCGIAESLTHTAIRQLIPSARRSSKNGRCKQSLGWQSAVCRTNSARSQLWPVTTAGTRAKADTQTPSTLEQVSWNRNQDFFIHSRPEQESEALCPLEHHRNGFSERWMDFHWSFKHSSPQLLGYLGSLSLGETRMPRY